MGNPVMGEVTFEADGKSYTFKLGTYAKALLQRETGLSAQKFFKKIESDLGYDDMLKIFRCGLYQKHKLGEEAVADLIDSLGEAETLSIIAEAAQLARPAEAEESAGPQEGAAKN
jgi:hypothetical protein